MSGPRVVVVGDAILDRDVDGTADRLAPDAPVPVIAEPGERLRAGGAALAASCAARSGAEVVLVTATGADEPGRAVLRLLGEGGVEVVGVDVDGPTSEKTRIHANGRVVARVDRGCRPGPLGPLPGAARRVLEQADAVLVSDYGRGISAHPEVREAVAAAGSRAPVVWDPHPRGAPPVRGVTLATPNRSEALLLSPIDAPDTLAGHAARAVALRHLWEAGALSVTLGQEGALLVNGAEHEIAIPAPRRLPGADPCGAGDSYAAGAAIALGRGERVERAVAEAVMEATRFVAGTAEGAGRHAGPRDAAAVIGEVRARGGRVVAAGGCFDILHAGHVRMLEAARALGDCLVVLLNSDESVRRLKGADRPLVPEADRAAVLSALASVDAVEIFDEDTPERCLARLRPDIFAKGADYEGSRLPEAEVMAAVGGRVVFLPYVDGRSTSGLIRRAVAIDAR